MLNLTVRALTIRRILPVIRCAILACLGATSWETMAQEPAFELTILQIEDDRPIAEADVQIVMFGKGIRVNQKQETDKNGYLRVDYPEVVDTAGIWMTAKHAGRVPYHVNFGRQLRFDTLPGKKTIRMKRGVIVKGTVVDHDGNPVPNVAVDLSVPATESLDDIYFQMFGEKTDEHGQFSFDSAPEPIANLRFSTNHPDFISQTFQIAGDDGKYKLDPGFQVHGRVTEKKTGKPVADAFVQSGNDRFGTSFPSARTDEDGRYQLKALDRETTTITITPPGRLAPAFQSVNPGDGNIATLDFALQGGSPVRFQMVDSEGQPLSGVRIVTDTWGRLRTLKWEARTDANGQATWEGAPPTEVQMDILKSEFVSVRNFKVVPRDEPYRIEMLRQTNVTAIVTDKQTGASVNKFTAKFGKRHADREEVYWNNWNVGKGSNGLLTMKHNEPAKELYVRIDAEGYQPWISEPLDTKQVNVAFTVQLVQDDGVTGRVVLPSGRVAVGAKVIRARKEDRVSFGPGFNFAAEQERSSSIAQTETSDEGEFRLPTPANPALLLFIHEEGYAELLTTELGFAPVKLQPWAKLEVTIMHDGKPRADANVHFYPEHISERPVNLNDYGFFGRTDEAGKLSFDRVVPRTGWVIVGRGHPTNSGQKLSESRKITVEPGRALQLEFGAGGYAVKGRAVIPPGSPVSRHRWDFIQLRRTDDQQAPSYIVSFGEDGSFEYDSLPKGEYQLSGTLVEENERSRQGWGQPIGSLSHDFAVMGETDQAIDLGKIEAKWLENNEKQ